LINKGFTVLINRGSLFVDEQSSSTKRSSPLTNGGSTLFINRAISLLINRGLSPLTNGGSTLLINRGISLLINKGISLLINRGYLFV
jgi:hypothetical protein